MLFSFHCPACKGKLEADASLSGTQAECPECGKPVAIPEGRVDAGTTLAGFQLERRLGKGGMGEVYLARQLSVDRQVAVKILPPGFAADHDAVQRFLHEGRLAAKLDHHHIATVYEAGEDSGNYYLAMAYVEGESLDQRLKRDQVLPEAEALGIIRAVADALAYAWDEFQLLHRDIKPANIMVDRRGRIFLMDLGLAKSLGEESGLTLSGTILGTPQYMSPEQAQGHSDLGVPTDIYSLGATLYHLVTGTAPFSGDSALKVLHQHVYDPLPPPRERNPQVSEVCDRLIEMMMAKKPEDRYGDWRALLADLDRILTHDGSAAPGQSQRSERLAPVPIRPPTPQKSLAHQAQEALARQREAQAKAPQAAARPSPRRRPPWLLGLAAAGFLVLVLLVALALRGRGSTPVAAAKSSPSPAPVSPTSQTAPASAIPAKGQPWTVPKLGMEFVHVEPGTFRMGADGGGANEKPMHEVRITRGYWLGKYEVTQAEYEAITGRNPSSSKGASHPVEGVSWDDAVAFCGKLTERERAASRLPSGHEYRLPTEAEWEYAARGGAQSKNIVFAGSDNLDEAAWHADNSGGKPHPVGQKKPNELGLCDMSGNVWEWCHDWSADYPAGTVTDWSGPDTGQFRVSRGGAWYGDAKYCRATLRGRYDPSSTNNRLGFRVALAAPVAKPDSVATAPAVSPATPAATAPAGGNAPAAPLAARSPWDRITLPHTGNWALEFDGKDNYVVIPTLTWDGSTPLTIELVVRAKGSEEAVLLGNPEMGGIWLGRSNEQWRGFGQPKGEDSQRATVVAATNGRSAAHLAEVWDGHTIGLYVNGVRVATSEQVPGIGPSPAPFMVGCNPDAAGNPIGHWLQGTVECVRISRVARYTEDFGLEATFPLRTDADTLCLLDLEEGEGEVAKDASGNKHDGQIHGATWEPMWPCPVPEEKLWEIEAALRKANPEAADLVLRAGGLPDAVGLNLSGYPGLRDTGALAGLPVANLDLQRTGVQDLAPLRGMPLKALWLQQTPVSDLSDLRGSPLAILCINQTRVQDLSPLSECPLASFVAYDVPLADLSPIAGCPLRKLAVSRCQLQSLPVFTAGVLQVLSVAENPLSDLTPLAGLPLVWVFLPQTMVRDLSPLRSCPQIRYIGIPRELDAAAVAGQFPDSVSVVADPIWDEFVTLNYSAVGREISRQTFPPSVPVDRQAAAYGRLAPLLLLQQYGDALRNWQADSAEQVPDGNLAGQVAAVCSLPRRVLAGFGPDVGKTAQVHLTRETLNCEVREVVEGGVKVQVLIQHGQTQGRIGRTLAYAELAVEEKVRRLGADDTPERNLMRGLLAVEAGRGDIARKLFEKAGTPLGVALVRELDARQAGARDDAAKQAVVELLRQISRSPKLDDRAKVIESIRDRCGGDIRRTQSARKLLAGFEKEWGDSEAGRKWVPVVRDALNYPIDGDVPLVVPDLGMELVPISPGTFQMGSDGGEGSGVPPTPVHEVRITRGFWLGKYEVTQAEYEAIMGRNPAQSKGASNPVDSVLWNDAVAFCRKLTERERAADRLPAGYEYRLPTEAEWEYAARGGAQSKGFTCAGSNSADEVAWYGSNSGGKPHPVGQKKPNELGLYDMSGNMWEWCHDWESNYPAATVTDPSGPDTGVYRVDRGGGWINDAGSCRATNRNRLDPFRTNEFMGFRVALAAPVR